MSVTISIGWWLLPLAATIMAFGWVHWIDRRSGPSYGADIGGFILVSLATIISLIAWLVWAVLT